jgi:hypothetical protein
MSDELRGVIYYMRKAYDAEIELTAARAELAAARELLREARPRCDVPSFLNDDLCARIDAALKGGEDAQT